MKRIALISFHTCPLSSEEGKETGGMNVYVLELAKKLSEQGFVIDIFTRNQDEKIPKIVQVSERLRVIHLEGGPKKNIAKKELYQFTNEFVKSFFTFVLEQQLSYELIHAHYYLSGIIGLEIKKRLHIPIVINFHTLGLMKNLVAKNENEIETTERIDAEFLLAKESDMIISPSQTEKMYLEYLYHASPDKIACIIPGIDTTLFTPMSKEVAKQKIGADIEDKIILFVGRIEPLKGIDVLLYAIKIILQRNPSLPICLWIVGGDISQRVELWSEELQKLEALRKTLDITRSVKFVGKRTPSELPYYYNSAEIAVVASQYESFGMTALEAMACATPVITTDVTGVSDLFDKSLEKLITSANNPLLLANQIEHLLLDTDALKKAKEDVFHKVHNLDWKHVATQVASLYKKITL